MTLSYKWLSDYLPVTVLPERLSEILTSIGLEVESMHPYEEIRGGLDGLVIGEVLSTSKHPNADKLTLTRVSIGTDTPLSIVCGAPNVAAGQKVVVASVGTTIYPLQGEPLTMKKAKIRGEESEGMICAEDEIGLGDSHAGILVLPASVTTGAPAASYFEPYEDIVFEIGLTPNRMDAMSHWGVARDVCAYLSHHDGTTVRPVWPSSAILEVTAAPSPVTVSVEDNKACPRYSGIVMTGISVAASPRWMQQRLKAIGVRPINNIVDITNYVLHETGQPLHAFDAAAIEGNKVIVGHVPDGKTFVTLDGVSRKLSSNDLMIGNQQEPMCLAGVYGGLSSGVTEKTSQLFLESACFEGIGIRKTSFRHQLRTDAATRFEKGTDISATVTVLQRAVQLIRDSAGGNTAGSLVDHYPEPAAPVQVSLSWAYLKKLSGKAYAPAVAIGILQSLGFTISTQDTDGITVTVPFHKPDIHLAADLVEEILRIDGLDHIDIPAAITMTPAVESPALFLQENLREKIANQLAGMGFNEIMTNSITNGAYYPEQSGQLVTMINSLSTELNTLRPSLLETALEVVRHNLNHRNLDLRLFEFGKIYSKTPSGQYLERAALCMVLTGDRQQANWQQSKAASDIFTLKGMIDLVLASMGIATREEPGQKDNLQEAICWTASHERLAIAGTLTPAMAQRFGIKQPVYYAELDWHGLVQLAGQQSLHVRELPRFPAVERDLAVVVDKAISWQQLKKSVQQLRIKTLRNISLFDIFESPKLGVHKKSMAVNFTFQDAEKTLTDKEIEGWMLRIMQTLEQQHEATIRK